MELPDGHRTCKTCDGCYYRFRKTDLGTALGNFFTVQEYTAGEGLSLSISVSAIGEFGDDFSSEFTTD